MHNFMTTISKKGLQNGSKLRIVWIVFQSEKELKTTLYICIRDNDDKRKDH